MIRSLDALRGFQLERLACHGNGIESLEPLRGMPLKRLDAGMNPLDSIEPLHGLPLELLRLDATPIESIAPLRDQPLALLSIANCANIKDFSVLGSLLNLELIVVPDQTPQETLDSLQRQSPAIMIFNSDREGKYGDIENLLFRDAKQQR